MNKYIHVFKRTYTWGDDSNQFICLPRTNEILLMAFISKISIKINVSALEIGSLTFAYYARGELLTHFENTPLKTWNHLLSRFRLNL